MAKGTIGSFNGNATPGVNMVDVFREQEKGRHIRFPVSTDFSIQKIAISAAPGTAFDFNGARIVLSSTGVFETCIGMTEIESIVFQAAVQVNIVYLF